MAFPPLELPHGLNMAFPPLVYLINVPITIYCTRSQVNNCRTVYANGLSVRHSYSGKLVGICLARAFAFPRLVYVATGCLDDTARAHAHTKSLICLSIIKMLWARTTRLDFTGRAKQKSAISLTWITFTGSLWKTDKWSKFSQVRSSNNVEKYPQVTCLSSKSFVGKRWQNVADQKTLTERRRPKITNKETDVCWKTGHRSW
jgi:hypothetical protein